MRGRYEEEVEPIDVSVPVTPREGRLNDLSFKTVEGIVRDFEFNGQGRSTRIVGPRNGRPDGGSHDSPQELEAIDNAEAILNDLLRSIT
jgi:hypothetical protein